MKAAVIDGYGGADAVHVADVPEPPPGPGEVVVRLRAAALNRLDAWTVSGSLDLPLEFPHVLGADGAGEIHAVGDGVQGLRPGTSVVLNPGISCRSCERCRAGEQSECPRFRILGEHLPGTLAELVKVPAPNVLPQPGHLAATGAAALGVTFLTAYRMLFSRGRIRPGDFVLISGIGGGLALSLLQLARPLAGRIYVTSSSDDKLERALGLGADEGINYTSEDVGVAVRRLTGKRGVDLVVDSAGGDALDAHLRALTPGGKLVIAGATAGAKPEINLQRVFWSQLEVVGSTMGSDKDVADMLRAVAGQHLEPVVANTFALEHVRDAFAALESPDRFGKIVIELPEA